MKRKKTLLTMSICFLLAGCSNNHLDDSNTRKLQDELQRTKEIVERDTELMNDLKEKIEALEGINKELNESVEIRKNEWDAYVKTSDIANRFIQSYVRNNIDEMKLLTSDKFSFHDEYISYEEENDVIRLNILDGLETYRLNSFGYDDGHIFYEYIVYEEPYVGLESGFFINLDIQLVDGLWQIDSIEFDI